MTKATALAVRAPEQKMEIDIFPPAVPGGEPVKAIVKTRRDGQVVSFRTNVPLSEDRGEVYYPFKNQPTITALGYDVLNKFKGVSFIVPETLKSDDGIERPNPYVLYGERGEIIRVTSRQIGIGQIATGSMVAQDVTVVYEVKVYLAQDAWSKWAGKKYGDNPAPDPKNWGRLEPWGAPMPTDQGKWHRIDMPNGTTLWVDLTHADVRGLLGEDVNRQKFAQRNALTICRRNVLKRFVAAVKLDKSLTVPVVGWVQKDRDLQALRKMASEANTGSVSIDGEIIEVQREQATVVANHDEVDESLGDEPNEDMPTAQPAGGASASQLPTGNGEQPSPTQNASPSPAEPDAPASVAPTTTATKPHDANAAVRTKIRLAHKKIGADKADEILGGVGVEGLAEVAKTGSTKLLLTALDALESAMPVKPATRRPAETQEMLPT